MPRPSPRYLELPPAEAIPFAASGTYSQIANAQPRTRLSKAQRPAVANSTGTDAPLPSWEDLNSFHLYGRHFFLMQGSFGYIKDLDHVAGFQPHQFRGKPRLGEVVGPGWEPLREKWAIARLELVSLLKYEKPAVYISEVLPRMEQLQKAKTRPLDAFEVDALEKLHQGEDVVAEASRDHIRMMGALRASQQCLECHSLPRGELLGCFSYDLQRTEAK